MSLSVKFTSVVASCLGASGPQFFALCSNKSIEAQLIGLRCTCRTERRILKLGQKKQMQHVTTQLCTEMRLPSATSLACQSCQQPELKYSKNTAMIERLLLHKLQSQFTGPHICSQVCSCLGACFKSQAHVLDLGERQTTSILTRSWVKSPPRNPIHL